MQFNIRNILPNDYNEIYELRNESYPNKYQEKKENFISKINYEGCLVADLDGIIGYLISFPYSIGKSYPIDNFYKTSEDANCCYLYDICITNDFRKKGIAKKLINTTLKRKEIFGLTSILNSEDFWKKFGFRSFFETSSKSKYMMLLK